jgi:serine/threonine-protein kinase HipA
MAEELKRIGAPQEDQIELFGRMVFNAVAGNDDDHPRNHAVIFHAKENRWRLSPAFDVVPNPDEQPKALTLQLSMGRYDISREAILADAIRFGFDNKATAGSYLDSLLQRIALAFPAVEAILSKELHALMANRLQNNIDLLSRAKE